MKYFIDTEFIEKPGIELISIGIVSEDKKEYYAISKDFNLKKVWNRFDLDYGFGDMRNKPPRKIYWLRDNVLKPIWEELSLKYNAKAYKFNRTGLPGHVKIEPLPFTYRVMKRLIKKYGKSNSEIANEVLDFCSNGYFNDTGISFKEKLQYKLYDKFIPEFYGYYADYDWVVFCWLYGRMIDLPNGFPMYCNDLKQMMDDRGLSKEWKKANCPDSKNEHNALADAKWNLKLYNEILKS